MKERPIIFNGEMVRAILDGRKTQTRRMIKPQPDSRASGVMGPNRYRDHAQFYVDEMTDRGGIRLELDRIKSPFGHPGDRLWVREAWGAVSHYFDSHGNRIKWQPDRPATKIHEMPFGQGYYSGHVIYAADGHFEWAGDDDGLGEPRSAWKPSIHMPRWASRITLEITDVRVERLQEISEKDALAEGGHRHGHNGAPVSGRYGFKSLWRRINGPGSWDANPWVWVVEFKWLEGES